MDIFMDCLFVLLAFACLLSAGAEKSVKVKSAKITLTSINCALDGCQSCRSSVLIDGKDYSPKRDGINVIVLDPTTLTITSSASFVKTHSKAMSDFLSRVRKHDVVIASSQLLCNTASSSDLLLQKSVLYGLSQLGIKNTTGMPAVLFRSAAIAYCKDSCHPNLTSTMPLPIRKIHQFDHGPVMVYFTLNFRELSPITSSSQKNDDRRIESRKTLLLATIGTCASFVCIVLIFMITVILLRNRRKRKLRSNSSNLDRNAECELIACSARAENGSRMRGHRGRSDRATVEQSTSFRLFSQFVGPDDAVMSSSFATYIQVDQDPHHQVVYKIPSGVTKHDPPQHPPPPYSLHVRTDSKGSRASSNGYLVPHEYASPGEMEAAECSNSQQPRSEEDDEDEATYILPPHLQEAELTETEQPKSVRQRPSLEHAEIHGPILLQPYAYTSIRYPTRYENQLDDDEEYATVRR